MPPMRILILEDNLIDAELMVQELRHSGLAFESTRVDSEDAFRDSMALRTDVILADYNVPGFGAMRALEFLAGHRLKIPLIVVSGSISEDLALECIKKGATDYLLKDRLTRLGQAILQALERKRLEEQYLQAQKMEVLGTLAGGVAHDFNNLLTVMCGYSDMLLSKLSPDDPARTMVKEIQKAGNRAASLTRQLLAFSRQQLLEPKVLDLNAIVSDTDKMLRRLIGEDITLTTVLEPALGKVQADPGQVEQIIMNMAVNARDAMPQGGKLTIETSNVDLDNSYAQVHMDVQSGRYVMLAMSDTGCGMDEAIKARIFEPFFTTKGQGKGTGLGLATVFGIVKQSGGHIWVYSEPGHGTTFKIYLPLVEEKVSLGKLPMSHPAASGTETILVVEDEDAVRAVTVFALQTFGYTVLQASHGREAIRLCEKHQGPIHLLISDVVMPEMGGRKVADAALTLRPDMKVLYLSGYTNDAVVRHGILREKVAFLQKPFSPDALGRKVREVLDR